MVPRRKGGIRLGIKFGGLLLLSLGVLFALGGCAWIREWLNPNHAPVAVIQANPTSGEAPLEVFFDASESYDPDGDEISYEWDFGDGKAAEGKTAQHGFDSPGNYTVRLCVTDSKGKSDITSTSISVSQPSDQSTKEQTFDAQEGIEYDTGTGLKVSVPPAPDGGLRKLVVIENPTPQQPDGDFMELQSAYDVSVISEGGSQGQELAPSSGLSSYVRLTFEIPPGVDPDSTMIVKWTDEGWILATEEDSTGTVFSVGGELSPDGRSISLIVPATHLVSTSDKVPGSLLDFPASNGQGKFRVALGRFESRIKEDLSLDCFPVYPSARFGKFENKGTYVETKVYLHSPLKTLCGGIWFKVDVEGIENLITPPQWDPPHYEIERAAAALADWLFNKFNTCYLPPTKNEQDSGVLTLQFPSQGGTVYVSADPSAPGTLTAQIVTWIISLIPFGDLTEASIEALWSVVDNIIRSTEPSTSIRSGEVWVKTKAFLKELLKALPEILGKTGSKSADKITKELLKPANLGRIIANQITYNGTVALYDPSLARWKVAYIPRNKRPIAVGMVIPDQTVCVGTPVTLDASASHDSDGDSLTYHWEQTEGPKVNLATDPSNPKATFTPRKPGTYKFKLVVNDGKVYSDPVFVAITVEEKPDLQVGDVSVSKSSLYVGDAVGVTFTVKNNGGPLSKEFKNKIYLSNRQYLGGQDILLAEVPMVLHGGKNRTETVEVTIPQVPPGDWYLAVYVDAGEDVEESNENNNIDSVPITITTSQQKNQPPVIEALTATPSTVEPGGQSRVSVSAHDPEGDPLTYSWSASGGRLSSTTGPGDKIWTAPSTPGTYQVTVSVTDNKPGHSPVSRSVDLTVVARLTITTASLPAGQVGQSYRATLRAAGGTPPYRWSIKAGSLPSGLSLDPTTGVISGAPAESGTFYFTVQVRDSTSQPAERDFSISISSSVTKPHVSTNSATDIGETSATLKGFLDSTGGEECQVWFEYGTTTSYGHSTPKQALNTAGPFSAHISGLKPNATYHFKACASNSGGTTCGEDATFRTKAKIDQLPQIMRPQENGVFQAEVGKVFTLQIEAQDPEGQKLVYMLTEWPSSLTLDRDTGLIQWTPTVDFTGKKVKVTFYVSDRPIGQTAGREVYRTFYIEVQEKADTTPPTVVTTNPANNDLGAPITDTITVTFSEEVRRGTGSVTIINENNNRIAIQGISVSGCVLTIRLANRLAYSTEYAVGIGAGVVTDLAGNPNPEYSWAFRTRAPQAPPRPTLVAPHNGATGISTTPTLQWNPVSGAKGYAVQVARDTEFSDKVFNQVVLSTSVQVSPALDAGSRYFWRVAAMGEGESISSWSDVWSFTTESPPQTGNLWVESNPGEATVYVDGQYKGNTPTTGYLKIENLAAGDHTLKATKSGYKDWVGTVTVPAGSTAYKAVILEPMTVNAEIFNPTVNPSQIRLGGQVTLSCTVKNTGSVTWTFYVALTLRKPNGVQVDHPDLKPLNLNPGQQGSVSWSCTPDMTGSWDVIFGVWREASQQEAIDNTGWLNDFFTVTGGPTELITNGSFSEGAKGWSVHGDFWVGTGLPNYRTSPGYAAGGVDVSGRPINNAVGWMYQTVTIPSDISSATLTFWYNITSEETSTIGHDVLDVTIQDSSGHYLATVAILSNVDRSSFGNYRQINFDLTPYKGRTLRINFSATTNDSKHTVFRIDDVSLRVN